MKKVIYLSLFSCSIFPGLANGLNLKNENCVRVTLENQAKGMIHHVLLVTAIDNRMTLEQFVAKYAKTKHLTLKKAQVAFKATGLINCNGMVATANITGKANVITTAGHEFFGENCTPIKADSCFFALDGNPKTKRYPIDVSSLKTGGCVLSPPLKDGPSFHLDPSFHQDGDRNAHHDWATVKLLDTVQDVTAYKVPNSDTILYGGLPIRQLSGYQADMVENNIPIKTIEECYIRDVGYWATLPVQADCNGIGGTSGSAQFDARDEDPLSTTILAINVSAIIDAKLGSGYDPKKLSSVSVPLAGEFRQAVLENMGINSDKGVH